MTEYIFAENENEPKCFQWSHPKLYQLHCQNGVLIVLRTYIYDQDRACMWLVKYPTPYLNIAEADDIPPRNMGSHYLLYRGFLYIFLEIDPLYCVDLKSTTIHTYVSNNILTKKQFFAASKFKHENSDSYVYT